MKINTVSYYNINLNYLIKENQNQIDCFIKLCLRNLIHFCQLCYLEGEKILEENFLNLFNSIKKIEEKKFKKEFESIIFFICKNYSTEKLKMITLQKFEFLKFIQETDLSKDFLQIIKECIFRLSAKERVVGIFLFSLIFKSTIVLNFILQNILCSDNSYEVRVSCIEGKIYTLFKIDLN